ncbi:MAG TPA: hypothetical protein VJT67_02015 [Longimicrobiaceae bacterium]|nr:hypothetical protein [Longimicrobiaceae bacterium]
MISVIDTPAKELAYPDYFELSLRAQRVRVDWDSVIAALQAASDALGWDADFTVTPERRHVSIVIPAALVDHVAGTTLDFYAAVADRIGMKEFLSIWVDFDIPR